MLYLNKKDIEQLVDFDEMIEVIEEAVKVYETKDFVMPDRISVLNKDETYLYMPCFTEKVKGTKILTLYPENANKGEAVIQGVMLLNDPDTGKIRCILDGAAVTAYRTGAVGACGAKYTTKKDATSIGLIGTGVQAFYQSLYAVKIRNIKTINIFNRKTEKAEQFKHTLLDSIENVAVNVCETTEKLIKDSDIIYTVTNSKDPVIPNDASLLKGKNFIGIGSYKPAMREYPDEIFKVLDEVYIDVDFAKEETGDLCVPIEDGLISEDKVFTLGKIIGKKDINTSKTTLYKSVGMALFDIMVANKLYQKAVERGIGQTIE